MHSQAIRVVGRSASLLARGITATRIPSSLVFARSYRNRAFHKAENQTETPEITRILDDSKEETPVEESAPVIPPEENGVEDDSPELSLDNEELAEMEKETNHLFHSEEKEEEPRMRTERMTKRNFEDEFFRMTDAMNKKFIEDNVNDTLREEPCEQAQPVTMVEGEDMDAFFKRVLSLEDNEITTEEEDKRMSLVREETKEAEKTIKRNTWFNFMPAKELPEGPFGTYSPDQIYNSLEFDLLSRNAREVYKYEKDDMLLTEEVIKHAKMPEPLEAPKIPLYPNMQKYAEMVTFALNRNGNWTREEKQKVLDILAHLGSLESEIDESPKTPWKPKKYM